MLGDAVHGNNNVEEEGAAENNNNDCSCLNFLEWKSIDFGLNTLFACPDGSFNYIGMSVLCSGAEWHTGFQGFILYILANWPSALT